MGGLALEFRVQRLGVRPYVSGVRARHGRAQAGLEGGVWGLGSFKRGLGLRVL